MPPPTPEQAAAATAEVDAARAAVDRAARQGRPAVLVATAALTFLDFAAKDHLRPPGAGVVTAVAQSAILAAVLLEARANPVQPALPAGEAAAPLAAAGVGTAWFAAERLAVHALRRSRLRRPNTVAGVLLALSRPAATVVLHRLPSRDARV